MSLTDSNIHKPPNWPNTQQPPAVGESYIDPVFGERVHRLTDCVNMGTPGPYDALTPEYSSSAVINCDDTFIRLVALTGAQQVFSFPGMVHQERITTGSSSPSDYWWHRTDPDLIYSCPGNTLKSFRISTAATTTIHTFTNYTAIDGMGQSELSLDGKRLLFHATGATVGNNSLIVYDFDADDIVASVDTTTITDYKEAVLSLSGDYVVIQITTSPTWNEIWEVNTVSGDIEYARTLPDGRGHYDMALGPDGVEYFIMAESVFTNTLKRFRLDNGAVTNLLALGWGPPIGDSWFCSNSMHLDGWIYCTTSVYNGLDPDPDVSWDSYLQECFRVKYDGSVIERLCHNYTVNGGYWNTPRGQISRSGRYFTWASNYRDVHAVPPDVNYADTYWMQIGPNDGTYRLRLS